MVVPPTPVFLMDILASPSACGFGAPPRRSDDVVKDSASVKASTGVKDPTGEDTAADPRRERDIPKLLTGDVLDLFPEAARRERDLLLALAEDGCPACMAMTGFSPRGWWVSKEDADAVAAVLLKVAMPGLGKEHVKTRAEKDVLVIKGEGDKDSEGDDGKATPAQYKYTHRIRLSSHAFKTDQIKAEMKNGVLCVTVPKIKDEERKDVFEIKVE